MDKSQIIALSINILKSTPGTLARNVQIPKVDPCLLCGEELLSNSSDPIKEFTLASCGHIFHQKCLEKHLVNGEAICPNKECNKDIETFLSPGLEKNKDKEMELQESIRSSADETSAITTELTNSIATTVATAKQVDSDQTPVDDVDKGEEEQSVVDDVDDVDKGGEEQSVVDQEIDVDDDGDEDEIEVQAHPDASGKKRANEATDSSSSKKSKKHVRPDESNVLKRLIRELSSDTTRLSIIKEKKGLYRESTREVEGDRTFFELYLKISNAEERNENARHELIIAYHLFGEELEKRLAHYRKTNEDHVATKKVYNEVKDQLPKEVTKNAI